MPDGARPSPEAVRPNLVFTRRHPSVDKHSSDFPGKSSFPGLFSMASAVINTLPKPLPATPPASHVLPKAGISHSNHCHSPIHVKRLPGHIGCLVRGEVDDGRRGPRGPAPAGARRG